MDAALAGFALAFATTITNDLLFMVRRFVGLEQAMVRHQFRVFGAPTHSMLSGLHRASQGILGTGT